MEKTEAIHCNIVPDSNKLLLVLLTSFQRQSTALFLAIDLFVSLAGEGRGGVLGSGMTVLTIFYVQLSIHNNYVKDKIK